MILSMSSLQAAVYYIQNLRHCDEVLHARPLPLPPLRGAAALRALLSNISPSFPQVLFMKGTSLPAPGLETDVAPLCTWFLTRHRSCGSFKEFRPHRASLQSLVHVSRRADCEAAASQQGLSDLSQTGRLQELRAAELISCPDVSLALFSVYSSSLSLPLLPSPPTGKHG